jgi:hypothetical protein
LGKSEASASFLKKGAPPGKQKTFLALGLGCFESVSNANSLGGAMNVVDAGLRRHDDVGRTVIRASVSKPPPGDDAFWFFFGLGL